MAKITPLHREINPGNGDALKFALQAIRDGVEPQQLTALLFDHFQNLTPADILAVSSGLRAAAQADLDGADGLREFDNLRQKYRDKVRGALADFGFNQTNAGEIDEPLCDVVLALMFIAYGDGQAHTQGSGIAIIRDHDDDDDVARDALGLPPVDN